jgi:hypothetical protein
LVFRMPNLEYRNKTWSNYDLFMQLKKEVIRALLNHTGAIISNKFSHPKPNKAQQSRLRELASSSVMFGTSTDGSSSIAPSSDTTSSVAEEDESGDSDHMAFTRPSFNSGRQGSEYSTQYDSSIASSTPSATGVAISLTPPPPINRNAASGSVTPPSKRPWTSGAVTGSSETSGRGELNLGTRVARAGSIADSDVGVLAF